MARKARLRSDNRVYHVMLRGSGMQDIFSDDEDKIKMMQVLKEKKQDDAFFLYSFCIIENHIHLVIRENTDDISRILKRIATSFAFYYNKKHDKTGRVFQDRFKSETIDDGPCLLDAIRFVHQDPMKAGISETASYKWSSYPEYVGLGNGIIDCDEILDMFSKDKIKATREFIQYHDMTAEGKFLDITDEKLIDSANVYDFIKNILNDKSVILEDLKKPDNKKVRDVVILYLMRSSNLSRRRIAEVLGINRETVRKAVLYQK